jgi:LmbE family N-acetylglucosaminyl deacetylase
MNYQVIYLSPHLDDVVFSCGGQIYRQTSAGMAVLVVTVAAGDPPAVAPSEFVQLLHERWQLTEVAEVEGKGAIATACAGRRNEDALACRILGADYVHWDFLDCIYRLHPETEEPLYQTRDDIFGDVHPADELAGQLRRQMAALPAHQQLFVPLTAGHHVDHQLTRAAAEQCFGTTNLLYYEDYPYVLDRTALDAVLDANDRGQWEPQVMKFSEAALEAKVAAVLAYESQLSSFFTDHHDVEVQIKAHARRVLEESAEAAGDTVITPAGAERIWQHSH